MDIQPQYEHGKYGTFMFNLCAKWTKFLVKHRWLYYLLACTWGSLLTILGVLVTIVLAIAKIFDRSIEFKKFDWIYCIKCGPKLWGGFETGLMFIRDHDSYDGYINNHEEGHTVQNCLFGVFTPFIITIPSAIRYWYFMIRQKQGKANNAYDAMWFEDSATQCGIYASWYINQE